MSLQYINKNPSGTKNLIFKVFTLEASKACFDLSPNHNSDNH